MVFVLRLGLGLGLGLGLKLVKVKVSDRVRVRFKVRIRVRVSVPCMYAQKNRRVFMLGKNHVGVPKWGLEFLRTNKIFCKLG